MNCSSPPLFLKYSVSFHMRGIRRSVTTTDRGLDRKNVNHLYCLTHMCVSVCVSPYPCCSQALDPCHWIPVSTVNYCVCACVSVCSMLSPAGYQTCSSAPMNLHPQTHTLPTSHLINIYFLPSHHVLKTNQTRTA